MMSRFLSVPVKHKQTHRKSELSFITHSQTESADWSCSSSLSQSLLEVLSDVTVTDSKGLTGVQQEGSILLHRLTMVPVNQLKEKSSSRLHETKQGPGPVPGPVPGPGPGLESQTGSVL